MAKRGIEDAHRKLTDRIIDLPGIAGVGVGSSGGKPCLKVYVETGGSVLRRKIPSSVLGFPVSVEKSGPIRAQ
jgi:hypothetical protein